MERHYQLARAFKVRDEEFGLLFYICRTTGLVFINSGDLLKAKALLEGGTVKELLVKSQGDENVDQYKLNALDDLLSSLVKRGLVNAQG